MSIERFLSFGAYAAAGLRATRDALAESHRSFLMNRIPIAGAIVVRDAINGSLHSIVQGHNGRIPLPDGCSVPHNDMECHPNGYPTDHGETGCIRALGSNFASVDWSCAVFATTLSPCIMCTQTIIYLHGLGLSR